MTNSSNDSTSGTSSLQSIFGILYLVGPSNVGKCLSFHRHPTLFIIKEGNRVKLHVTAYVNGDPNKTILPIVDKNTWISLEYGIV